MAGHSKWANIKHRKERSDKKKGKIFTKVTKEIINAVREGGPDPRTNSRLKIVIQKAKDVNLPNDNIDRNIKKASSADQQAYSEMTYELYGYGGVGIVAEALTDNKNRTASEMRIATNKCGGTLANPGSVTYNFDKMGVLRFSKSLPEEKVFEAAIELGAEEFDVTDENYVVLTKPEDLYLIKEALAEKEFIATEASLEMIPKTFIECSKEDGDANLKLIEWLENLDDVDAVYHNMSIESD